MKNIKALPTSKHNTNFIFLVAILQLQLNGNFKKNKNLVGKLGLWLKTIIRRGVKVIEERFAGKLKRWHYNKKVNGCKVYTEKFLCAIFLILE